jgi:hypothetical protein
MLYREKKYLQNTSLVIQIRNGANGYSSQKSLKTNISHHHNVILQKEKQFWKVLDETNRLIKIIW